MDFPEVLNGYLNVEKEKRDICKNMSNDLKLLIYAIIVFPKKKNKENGCK